MDRCRRTNKRVCVTYIMSFLLLSTFFYYLMKGSSKNTRDILRLRDDVEDISVRIHYSFYFKSIRLIATYST